MFPSLGASSQQLPQIKPEGGDSRLEAPYSAPPLGATPQAHAHQPLRPYLRAPASRRTWARSQEGSQLGLGGAQGLKRSQCSPRAQLAYRIQWVWHWGGPSCAVLSLPLGEFPPVSPAS